MPQEELGWVKAVPKEERGERVEAYKERLLARKYGMADLQDTLVHEIHEDPEVSREKLDKIAEVTSKEFDWGEAEKIQISMLLDEYAKRHQAVKEAREENLDDRELFKTVFGREPRGEVWVTERPMTLHFKCEDLGDFLFATYGTDSPSAEQQKQGTYICAVLVVGRKVPPELEGTVVTENGPLLDASSEEENERTRLHEEQHAIKRIFKSVAPEEVAGKDIPQNQEEVRLRVEQQLRAMRIPAEVAAHDELLAYLKTGTKPEEVLERFSKPEKHAGFYDYLENLEILDKADEEVNRWLEPFREAYPAAFEKVFNQEYVGGGKELEKNKGIIATSIKSFLRLLKEADYSREMAAAALESEPLRKWPKVVRRLLGETRRKHL